MFYYAIKTAVLLSSKHGPYGRRPSTPTWPSPSVPLKAGAGADMTNAAARLQWRADVPSGRIIAALAEANHRALGTGVGLV